MTLDTLEMPPGYDENNAMLTITIAPDPQFGEQEVVDKVVNAVVEELGDKGKQVSPADFAPS